MSEIRIRTRAWLCGSVLVLGSASAHAMGPKAGNVALGQGNRPCSAWTEEHRKETLAGIAQNAWLMGSITSFDRRGLGQDVSSEIAPPDLIEAMSRECRDRPQGDIAATAARLVAKLDAKRHMS